MANQLSIYRTILNIIEKKGAAFFVLIDPDRLKEKDYLALANFCQNDGADAVLVGSSILISHTFKKVIKDLKRILKIPVIIFPGNTMQISEDADAILFLSLISGRNPSHLFGDHVLAAPAIKAVGLEPISTGYMLIESGRTSSGRKWCRISWSRFVYNGTQELYYTSNSCGRRNQGTRNCKKKSRIGVFYCGYWESF